MRDYKVGGRGRANVGEALGNLLAALAGTPSSSKAQPNTDNKQTTPALDDSGTPISNANNVASNNGAPAAPNFWQRLLNPQLATQYQQGQFGLAQERERGGQERQTKTTENTLNKDYQDFMAKLDYMQKNGVAPTLENFKAADAATTGANISRLGFQAKTGESIASGIAKEAASPQGQDVVAQNFLSQENEPFARNMSLMPKIAPYDTGYQRLPDQYTLSIEGGRPGSTTSSSSGYAVNPKTGFPTQTSTSTTTPTFSGANVHDVPTPDYDAIHQQYLQQQQMQNFQLPLLSQNSGGPLPSPTPMQAAPMGSPGINPSPVLPKPTQQMGQPAPFNPNLNIPTLTMPLGANSPAMYNNGQALPDWMRQMNSQQWQQNNPGAYPGMNPYAQ